MSEYRAPIKDALFTLRHIGEMEQLSEDRAATHTPIPRPWPSVLEEQGRFMQEVFGPTNAIGDTVGLKWTPGGRRDPRGVQAGLRQVRPGRLAGPERPRRVRRCRVPRGRAGLRARVLHRGQRRAHHGTRADHRRHRAAPGVGHRGAEGGLPPQAGHRRVDRHHEPDRAAGRLRRRPVAPPRRSRSATAPTRSPAPRSTSRSASTTWPTTSSTWCWPACPRRRPAPRASRCSSCPSSW